MLRILIDQNFDQRILRGLLRRTSGIDYLTTYEIGFGEASDVEILEWAAQEIRIILTHDINTFPEFAFERMAKGEKISGVVIVPQEMPIGKAIDDLEIIITCSVENEWENIVRYLPL